MVPTAHDWPVWVGVMLTTHFDLVSSPFWAPRGPKRDRFGPKCPFWGPRRSSEGPEGPDLVPTAPDWPALAGHMLLLPVSFEASRDCSVRNVRVLICFQKTRFWYH